MKRRIKKKKMRDGEAIGETIDNGSISNIVETKIIGRRELRNNHTVTNLLTVTSRVTDGPVINRDREAADFQVCGILPLHENFQNSDTISTSLIPDRGFEDCFSVNCRTPNR